MFNITITERCHRILREYIHKGDLVIDATCGNGYDTVFLADSVGPEGRVLAFDIQGSAIKNATVLAEEKGYFNINFFNEDNLNIKIRLQNSDFSVVKNHKPTAIMYNLGYLPGGDYSITTMAETTIKSIALALELLAVNGVMSVITYPGHTEGKREAEQVLEFLGKLPAREYEVLTITQSNRSISTPVMHLIYKLK